MGDSSFQSDVPGPLLSGKELPTFKLELQKSKGKVLGNSFGKEVTVDCRQSRRCVQRYTFLLACVLISGGAAHLLGANMRSFIESVRRKAPVVYVGSVKEVRVLQRTKFDIKAKALVDIKAVMRTPGSNPQQASVEYSSFDDKTPMLEGGPQYQLRPGVWVIAFANSFDANVPPGYLVRGSRQELLQRVEALRDALSKMSPDQLRMNEITEDDRRVQMSLYEKLSASLRAAK
jgi:hypothetical protein